ncbi:Mannan endo-1,6-alpha-mannosidase [Metarhizium album ARSEF 1941]|uniref:Mannan endo-1,6-alpha-mannosidase n=1 Tax=Metarhizium album (strain ARSEF 1941) TaxID=1081103 RepID=A0A0B2WPB6_METAS|nr:Mannan endo-1,6-alpha-mannosidase [Metarhizium album ARSEF 1941]KHN94830.1 Mannan endo-1,6-alpha-mannosidase [Metarhizium album ARSEF 1941]
MVAPISSPALVAMASSVFFAGIAKAQYNVDTRDNIIASSKSLAFDLMKFYRGNQSGQIPGLLPGPPASGTGDYYWWEAGAMMGTYMDYWKLTGDATYNDVVTQGMLFQVGPQEDYMPPNQTLSLGNDDQGFWGLSALLAAENKFPDPPADQPQWLELAQAVWNTQADPSRHDETCNSGLRWQIPRTNAGYDYKNTIANGIFFNMGARLARYTGNNTYADRASATWDWLWNVRFIDNDNWAVYDGASVNENCTKIQKIQYSYNAAVMIQGAAFMYNRTSDDKWKTRLDSLLDACLKTFFPKQIAYEVSCEFALGGSVCKTDMLSYKGYLLRWLAVVAQIAPHTASKILEPLRKSGQAAAAQCTGGSSGRQCGFYWSEGKFIDPSVDKTTGVGEAMDVLAAVSSMLMEDVAPPVTHDSGGTSRGNPNAGGKDNGERAVQPVTAGDRAGAAILTVLLLGGAVSLFVWMNFFDPKVA